MRAFYPTPLVAQALLPVRLVLRRPPCRSAGLCPALWGLPTLYVGKPGILARLARAGTCPNSDRGTIHLALGL
jgi:hypothetical protein